jgi:predicted metal-dependent HD superfamily phosphohydrolase
MPLKLEKCLRAKLYLYNFPQHAGMSKNYKSILEEAEQYLIDYFRDNIGAEYVFHDFQHTKSVVESVTELGEAANIESRKLQLLQLAAWFHDSGYSGGSDGHEERSCRLAVEFLRKHNLPEEDINVVTRCIMATHVPCLPKDLLEELLCDADLSHLGRMDYWDRCGRNRQELLLTRGIVMSEQEWVEFELAFLNAHRYFTQVAEEAYNFRKMKHIKQLRKQKVRLNPREVESVDDLARKDKNKGKAKEWMPAIAADTAENEFKDYSLGRGVETMYRTVYRTHISLSGMADNKANIMLSINAIVISIALPQLFPKFQEQPELVVPSIILLTVCVASIVLATLSTRPKITSGKFSRRDIEANQANLLFFGNFHQMKLEDYHWGMMEMIKDKELLYSSMTRDLYFLGIVLASKFHYLSYCYNVFMFGMIVTVIAFVLAFVS